ncbi:Ig-like domain-containing protein [candidate division WWE3 bacterium]|uniref:Ig-like domain-containing protein n=1 Tax=candidate division WWE3 bacterium TaxID=2053526 RepID=A0A955RWY2_UNCKA|nr:Ig-like domain-containing protein [candidate division WWE3 bacterium]
MLDSIDAQVLFKTFSLQHLYFEERFYAVLFFLGLIVILFFGTSHYWLQIYKKLRKHPDAKELFHGHMSLVHAFHDIIFISKIILIIYLGIVIRQTIQERPYVAWTNPSQNSRLTTAAPNITIHFTVPVDKDNITFYTSPVIEGEWIWSDGPAHLPLYQNVTFHPKESFYPNSHIVVYMVGLRSAWNSTDSHELALDYSAPRIPRVLGAKPDTNATNVPIDSTIEILYDGPVGPYIDTHVDIQPKVDDFEISLTPTSHLISFGEPLKQDQEYTISLYLTPRSYDVLTQEDIERGDSSKISEITFHTVTTPLINSFEPRGDTVMPDSTITITFDQEMQRPSVMKHFSIEPKIEGKLDWSDVNILTFTPDAPLPKDTSFTITLSEGMESVAGGATGEPIHLLFKTIGPVTPVAIYPTANTSGLDPQTTNISITFDQEVEHESAQKAFRISPAVAHSFEWEENTMKVITAGNLTFSTRYNVTLASGIETIYGLDSDQEYNFQFTTKSDIFSLSVPYYRQEETFTCNIAATRMALAYRGVILSEDAIQSAVGIGDNPNSNWVPGYGTHVDTIANFVSQYRKTTKHNDWNVPDMLREVEKGNPVIIWEYNRYSQPYGSFTLPSGIIGYKGMHSEVVRGYIGNIDNPSHILTNDPWRGQLTYDINTFKSVWSYLNNTALVIY